MFAAVIGLINGGLVLLLPEMRGKTLPETIEDAENLHRYDIKEPPMEQSYSPLHPQNLLIKNSYCTSPRICWVLLYKYSE